MSVNTRQVQVAALYGTSSEQITLNHHRTSRWPQHSPCVMESTPRNVRETVPAIESETSLTTTTFLNCDDNNFWESESGQNVSLALGLSTSGVDNQTLAAAARTGEPPSSPTQHPRKRRCARERTGSVEVTSPPLSYHDRIWMTELDGDCRGGDESSQVYPSKARSQKDISPRSIHGYYESPPNSTPSGVLTRPSNIGGGIGGEEPGRPCIPFQSTAPWRHSAKPMSANAHAPPSFNDIPGSGMPLVNSCATVTPQRRTTSSGSRNSSSSGSGSRNGSGCRTESGSRSGSIRFSSSQSVTPSKRSGRTPNSEEGPSALRMICWHNANGVDCGGGRSTEPRRLLWYAPPHPLFVFPRGEASPK
jgi:hypothetical protein